MQEYHSQIMTARIGGVGVRFEVEFKESITDPAKLPLIKLTVDSHDPVLIEHVKATTHVTVFSRFI